MMGECSPNAQVWTHGACSTCVASSFPVVRLTITAPVVVVGGLLVCRESEIAFPSLPLASGTQKVRE